MALDTVVKNLNDGTITIKDATGSPITTGAVQFSNGDFSISGLRKKLKNVNYYQARGAFTSARHTDRVFPTFSFTCQFSGFTNATAGIASDAVMKAGAFIRNKREVIDEINGDTQADRFSLDTLADEWDAMLLKMTAELTENPVPAFQGAAE